MTAIDNPIAHPIARHATLYETANTHGRCYCCGAHEPLIVIGERYRGQMHWSAAYCSIDCHDVMHGIDTDLSTLVWEHLDRRKATR